MRQFPEEAEVTALSAAHDSEHLNLFGRCAGTRAEAAVQHPLAPRRQEDQKPQPDHPG